MEKYSDLSLRSNLLLVLLPALLDIQSELCPLSYHCDILSAHAIARMGRAREETAEVGELRNTKGKHLCPWSILKIHSRDGHRVPNSSELWGESSTPKNSTPPSALDALVDVIVDAPSHPCFMVVLRVFILKAFWKRF